jgi:hypothetical protein
VLESEDFFSSIVGECSCNLECSLLIEVWDDFRRLIYSYLLELFFKVGVRWAESEGIGLARDSLRLSIELIRIHS